MITTESFRGRVALMVAHCAGMVDLVALPLWVGSLMGHYKLDPQQAGGVVTLFLIGVVLASSTLAPRFARLPRRTVAVLGFGVSALAFFAAARQTDMTGMALLHALAGVATGAALSVTHGSVARSARPHRLFAIVGTALGVFSVAFFAIVPQLLQKIDGSVVFLAFSAVMAVAAVTSLLAFPQTDPTAAAEGAERATGRPAPMPRAVWFGIAGVVGLGITQAMIFAFLERVGNARGFGVEAINTTLVAISLINLAPAPLAALLERRLAPRNVMLVGPLLQALLAATVMLSATVVFYAAGAALFPAVIIFTHTFAFGLLARLEPTGRALAATPAMMMTGAAIGPVLGGTLVKAFGYGSLAMAAAVIAALSIACFLRLPVPQPAPVRSVPA